ncbi:MAG TPA: hypothetical protein VGL81_04195 [Polyangiaceae bacterium]
MTLDDEDPSAEGSPKGAPPPSWEELVELLRRLGAVIIARQEHGVFLRARRRLIFVRRRSVVEPAELLDVLRAAGLTVDRFAVLLENARRLSA